MRAWLTRLHRWFGLFTAAFLFVAGATGAVIAWDHELDGWLNPAFYVAESGAAPSVSGLELADRLEAAEPTARVTFVELATEPGHTLMGFAEPRIDPSTGAPFAADWNQVAWDPATGEEQARRSWGRISLAREDVLPFLYKLHYSLHLPIVGGTDTGMLLMGLVAVVWVIDCFVSLVIAFPSLAAWRRSLRFRLREGGLKLLFDVHRSGGVWAWGLLLVLAVTAVALNLGEQVVRPAVGAVLELTPDPFDVHPAQERPVEPSLSRAEAVAVAAAEADRRGLGAPAGAVFYSSLHGLYGVGFYPPGEDHPTGLGNPWIYVDGRTGALAGAEIPGGGTLGDLFLQAQFPLHSGRVAGTPGRVVVSLLGAVIATLSVTGVWLWARKAVRRAASASAPASASSRPALSTSSLGSSS